MPLPMMIDLRYLLYRPWLWPRAALSFLLFVLRQRLERGDPTRRL